MNNQLSIGVNFQARMVPTFPVEELPGFSKVQERFMELTKNKPNKVMYLSKQIVDGDGEYLITHLSKNESMHLVDGERYFEGSNIVNSTWQNLKKRFNDKKLADFFARRFNIMALEDSYNAKKDSLIDAIESIKCKADINYSKSKSLKESGNETLSGVFNALATRNMQTYKNLKIMLDDLKKSYEQKYHKIAKNDPELLESFMA